MGRAPALLKRVVVGRPLSTGEFEHTLLPKTLALPVFSSDALSSNAYATQEILLVLGLAGAAALGYVTPISLAVAALLTIVVVSYRQTVRAYPGGGGAYTVAHDNLGAGPGLVAGSALLVDYVLTVSVSITAGTDAIASALPAVADHKVLVAAAFVAFVTLLNLRGARESGIAFAVPTYAFIASMGVLLAAGAARCTGGCPPAESADLSLPAVEPWGWLLALRAFAAGTAALTGVEAISNGVRAFRYPQSRNAATTLAIMGAISVTMFLGISLLAHGTGVRYVEHLEHQRTVLAQIAAAVFGQGPMFYVIQAATAGILILAANTAFADFPRLASILAADRYMPRQFMNRGDRLVFSNGIIILAVLACFLVWVFEANLNRLIQLYLVGVFVSFTLSQSGMVVHWARLRDRGWRRRAAINAVGAVVTGVVLVVVLISKFTHGAWIVVAAQPLLIGTMVSIHRHYADVARQLSDEARRPADRRLGHQHLVLYVNRVDAAAARAVGYARSVRAASVRALGFDPGIYGAWERLAPDIPLEVLEGGGYRRQSFKRALRALRAKLPPDDFCTVVVPELLASRSLFEIVRSARTQAFKASLLREPGIQVLDVPVVVSDVPRGVDQAHEPSRNLAVVLVAGVHNATLQAIEYAETLAPTDIRAVTFGLEPERAEAIGDRWLQEGIPYPLEIVDSPYRDIGGSLRDYVRRLRPDGIDRVVTVVIPEFVVARRRHQLLHGQTALIVKRHLLFEPGVVVASVPYHLGRAPSGS